MFYERLKKLRKDKNLSQVQLAGQLGVTTGAIGLWETNRRMPDYNMLIKIAVFFEVSIDYLLNEEKKGNIMILGSNGSFKSFNLSEKDLKSIENLAETLNLIDEK